jgi:hypothetical protein
MFGLRFIAIVNTAVLLSTSALAGTSAVGTCLPNLPFYSTIQQAVISVPADSTVLVCPGNYAEQVVISQPLTLKGMAGESDAIVSVPPGGLTKSVTPGGFVKTRYQILVQNTTGPVEVSNLAVDGTGASVGSSQDQVAGIIYVDSTGTVSHVSVRNQPEFGSGIVALTSAPTAQTVTVQNSVVRLSGFYSFGILAYVGGGALTTSIHGNTIRYRNNPGTGIQVYRATGTVQSNAISDAAYGIDLFGSSVTAAGNTISTGFIAVYVLSGSNTIKSNKIDAGGATGMILAYDATNSAVQGNAIANSATAISGCGLDGASFSFGFTITGNTIIDATVGMQMPGPFLNDNITTPNNYYATATAVAPQPCY